MKIWIPTCAIAAACAASVYAQDSTVTTRTQVKADDAKAITATGCLVPGLAPGNFSLRGTIVARGEEVNSKTETAVLYELSPRTGVDLTAHVGQQVQVTAIVLERGKGDADVKVKEETEVDRDDGKDGKSTTESKLTVARGSGPRLNVISVKSLGQPCG
jgi:hypothetical protein